MPRWLRMWAIAAVSVMSSPAAGPALREPATRRGLSAAWDLYAFQTADGPELVSYLSVEAGGLRPAPNSRARAISLSVLLSVGDSVTETSTQLDTIIAYLSVSPLAGDAVLHWALPLRTPAVDHARVTITVENQADSTQGLALTTTWRVPAFAGRLLLSDLVVGELRNGTMLRGTYAIAPAPGHAVSRHGRFRLYYELYGVRAADPLFVNIQVAPVEDESFSARLEALKSNRASFSVEFEDQASPDADGVLRVERELQAQLAPGAYALAVKVRNARTGETAFTVTNLIVRSR